MRDFPILHGNVVAEKYKFFILTIFIDENEIKIRPPKIGWNIDILKKTIDDNVKGNLWCAYLDKYWIGSSEVGGGDYVFIYRA